MDDSTLTEPLERVAALVQCGFVSRLWIFLIDPDGRLRREVQQIDGIPITPDAHAVPALRGILDLVVDDGQEAVVVIERAAAAEPTPDDWAWHDAIRSAARGPRVTLRGVLLAHRDGVDVLAPRTLTA